MHGRQGFAGVKERVFARRRRCARCRLYRRQQTGKIFKNCVSRAVEGDRVR